MMLPQGSRAGLKKEGISLFILYTFGLFDFFLKNKHLVHVVIFRTEITSLEISTL